MAAKLPCPDCQHSDVCRYLKDVVNTINDIYKRLAYTKDGRLPIQIEVHCEFYEGEQAGYEQGKSDQKMDIPPMDTFLV